MKLKKILSMLLAISVASTSVSASAASLQVEGTPVTETVSGEVPIEKNYVYGIMKIPYASFYEAELEGANDIKVDTVTSATAAKWQRQEGTYYEAAKEGNGGTIIGVEYYVAIEKDVYEELVKKDSSLVDEFSKIEEIPATYKVMDKDGNFSAVQGKATELTDVKSTFTTSSNWGDYQMNFSGLGIEGTVYGVVVETSDGAKYGMRHLENIWNNGTQISWSSGVKTTEARGNTLSYEHYASMMGKTITGVTWIADTGIYTVNDLEYYVSANHKGTVTVPDGNIKDGMVSVTTDGLPEDGKWEVVVPETLSGAKYKDGVLSYDTNAMPGAYTLTLKDTSNKYTGISTSFVLKTEALPVQFATENSKIVAADGSAETDAANFIKNISTVTVTTGETATTYKVTGSCCCAVKFFHEDATLNLEAAKKGTDIFSKEGTYTLTVNATGYENSLTFDVTVDYVYGTVKIPYNDFYSAELSGANDVEIDAVTSATASKWQKQVGTYYEAATEGEGGTILGVESPVAMERSAYEALKKSGNAIISTFTESENCAAAYKRIYQDGSLSATNGETKELENVTYTFATSSTWGDYQMNFTGLEMEGTVYGVIIETTDGAKYGLRHLENIWKKATQLSWSSGIKTVEAKGNTLSYAHYASLMGKTIAGVTWITDAGMYKVSNLEQYVAVKYNGTVTIPETKVSEEKVTVTTEGFPEDGTWNVVVPETLSGASYKDGVLSFDASAMPGSYTLTIRDASNKYAETSASFVLTTETLPVQYKDSKLVAAEGSTEAEAANYIKNISTVTVKFGETSKTYKSSGKGSVSIVNEDGSINEDAVSGGTGIFAEAGNYELTVVATGYNDLTFTHVVEAKAVATTTPESTNSVVSPTAIPTSKPTAASTATPTSKPTATPKPAKVTAPKKVTLSKATNVKGKKVKVTWKKVSGAAGYQIVIATNKKFTSGKKTITVKSGKITSKTISKLKKKKTYYVKVRAYKTSKGNKVWGNYSNVKKVTVKK